MHQRSDDESADARWRRRAPSPARRIAAGALALGVGMALALAMGRHAVDAAAAAPGDDHLAPELRSEVERLKVEAEQPSTNLEVLGRRLEVLWQWSEAFALQGGLMPPDYPLNWGVAYRATLGAREAVQARTTGEMVEPGEGVTIERISGFIRDRVRELTLKEERPGALGTLALENTGPFLAGEMVTIVQTYTVGEEPMRPGSRLLVAHRRAAAFQLDDPRGDGYASVSVSRPGVTLARERPSPRWQSAQIAPVAALRVEGGTLEPGDVVTITYGDRSGGSRGVRVNTGSVDEVVLPVFVDLGGDGNMMRPAWPPFSVVGRRETRFVNAVAPSLVRPGETFTLAVRSEDMFKNPISGTAPGYDVLLAGRTVAKVAAGGPAMALVDGLSIAQPGVHRFEVGTADGALAARSNPVVVDSTVGGRLLWGDTHGHSGFAEGQGSPEGYFRFGRDVARLDFLTLSEHDIWMDAWEWRVLQEQTEKHLDPGRFTPILGYEWTAYYWNGGHHNVFFRTTAGRDRVSHQWTMGLQQLYGGLRQVNDPNDVLIIPHAHMPGDWRQNDAGMERVVEITSGHGGWEWFGNRYLENGFRVGFVGSSDNHAGHPGYSVGTNRQLGGLAAVFAPENSRDAIFDSLRARRCYATTGERIVLLADLNGTPMGQEAPLSDERSLRCRMHGTQPIDSIEVVKNGDVVYSRRYLQGSVDRVSQVQLVFESATEIYGAYRGPGRRQRNWNGSIEVRDARLDDFAVPWYHDPRTDRMERDSGRTDRLEFSFNTRGRGKGFVLELTGSSEASEVVVHLEAELADTQQVLPVDAEHFPEQEFVFRLGDLARSGAVVHELRSGPNVDRVEAQVVAADGPLDQVLEWRDLGERADGDWYYVRARQIDGSTAWSSPIWVGRAPLEPPRIEALDE